MSWIDWIVVGLPLVIVLLVGVRTNRYVKSVADFLAANRSAGRYLLCISGAELQTGAVSFVTSFEIFARGGFAYTWWAVLGGPIALLVAQTGFVTYRFRETRAMTLAQFFEIRYSRSFRLFTGLLAFFAGLLNFGIMPAIGARTMVYLLGLPEWLHIATLTLPTYVVLMAVFLSVTAFLATSGGVVTAMVVNTLEGIISQGFFLVLIFTVLALFSWSQMHTTLLARPPGESMVNPFDTYRVADFNGWTIIMAVCTNFIATGIAWQNTSGYKSAGLTAHENRMAGILSSWQGTAKSTVITLLALAAITYLHHPVFASASAHVHEVVANISNKQAQEEMEAPIALAQLLPVGVKGMLCAVLLMGIFGGDATSLHSWGSIFIQDMVVPLRKTPLDPAAHLYILRAAIIGVALFSFLFGTFFHVADYLTMWFTLTQAVFTGGAGCAIIGGLYWKKGTSAGAWAGFITGSVLSAGGIVAQQVWVAYGGRFPLNGIQIGFGATISAVMAYVLVSLLTCREEFDLDRMLHRGRYTEVREKLGEAPLVRHGLKHRWAKWAGFDDNFSRSDKWLASSVVCWGMFWFFVWLGVNVWNAFSAWPTEWWVNYCRFCGITLAIPISIVTAVWFSIGGFIDLRQLFCRLRHERVNSRDDGSVIDHRNLDEVKQTDVVRPIATSRGDEKAARSL